MTNQQVIDFVAERLHEDVMSFNHSDADAKDLMSSSPTLLPSIADELIQHCVTECNAIDNLSVVIMLLDSPENIFLS